MTRTLFQLLVGCKHEFCWPRRCPEGDYYQVCVHCGAEYNYDWTTMRRTRRMRVEAHATRSPARPCTASHTVWRPRARRLAIAAEVRYRQPGSDWHSGLVRNVSQSGVLLEGEALLDPKLPVELIFEMPAEICGRPQRRVLCSASVVRVDAGSRRMAASIAEYSFLAAA